MIDLAPPLSQVIVTVTRRMSVGHGLEALTVPLGFRQTAVTVP